MEIRLIDANELLRYIGNKLGFVVTKTDVLRAVELQPTIKVDKCHCDNDAHNGGVDVWACGYQ